MSGDERDADLPAGAYLASRYRDAHRDFETRRVYHDDGRVEAFDGNEWWEVCRFSPDQVERARSAVRESGLPEASDLTAEGVHDTASLTYAWKLDGETGRVTNWAYPAKTHPIFARIEQALDDLEAEAEEGIADPTTR